MTEKVLYLFEESDLKALKRFKEISEDSEAHGHDLSKDQIKRLENIGALRNCGFGLRMITDFGEYILDLKESEK